MNGYPRFGWVDILRFQHQVLLYDEEGNLLKQIDDVYLDNLAETIDLNVENDKVENYNAKVMNFLIGA